jgi:hypothetical protein
MSIELLKTVCLAINNSQPTRSVVKFLDLKKIDPNLLKGYDIIKFCLIIRLSYLLFIIKIVVIHLIIIYPLFISYYSNSNKIKKVINLMQNSIFRENL